MARDWKSEAAIVIDALLSRGQADWPGVGNFRVVDKAARAGVNPQTGRPLVFPGRRLVRLRPDPRLLDSLEQQESVEVDGFGLFEVQHYPAYEGRNPRTGERIQVEAKRGVLFRSAPELGDRLAGVTLPPSGYEELVD